MNKEKLLEMIGQMVMIRPAALRVDLAGYGLPRIDYEWQIRRPTHKWALLNLHNPDTGYATDVGGDNIQEFRTPNFLFLKAQIILTPRGLRIEPLLDARARTVAIPENF